MQIKANDLIGVQNQNQITEIDLKSLIKIKITVYYTRDIFWGTP